MKFRINPRTCLPEMVEPEQITTDDLFRKVKRVHSRLINHHGITDAEIKEIISKVDRGTRNVHYLVPPGQGQKFRDIANYILREMSC